MLLVFETIECQCSLIQIEQRQVRSPSRVASARAERSNTVRRRAPPLRPRRDRGTASLSRSWIAPHPCMIELGVSRFSLWILEGRKKNTKCLLLVGDALSSRSATVANKLVGFLSAGAWAPQIMLENGLPARTRSEPSVSGRPPSRPRPPWPPNGKALPLLTATADGRTDCRNRTIHRTGFLLLSSPPESGRQRRGRPIQGPLFSGARA